MLEPAHDFFTHKFPYEWPYRGEGKPGQYGKLPQGMEWKIKEWTDRLYTIPAEDPYALAPGSEFTWTRLRAVGGRTNLWGRGCDRFGPRSEEHTSELQSRRDLVCRLLLEKKNT